MWRKNCAKWWVLLGAMLCAPLAHAQSNEEDWQEITSIEVDLTVENLAPTTTAVVVRCEIYTRAPRGIAGYGYMVLFDPAQQDNPASNMTAENDIWTDRIAYEPIDNLVESGISQKVSVPVFGDEVDYRFWTNGQCELNLFFNEISALTSYGIQGALPIPWDCSELAGEEFYRLVDVCVAPGYPVENGAFTFDRETENAAGEEPGSD